MTNILPAVKGYQDFTSTENKEGLPLEFVTDGRGVASTFSIPERFAGWRAETFVAAHPGAVDTVLITTMGRAAIFGFRKAAQIKSFTAEYFDLVPIGAKLHAQSRVVRDRGDGEVVIEARIRDAN